MRPRRRYDSRAVVSHHTRTTHAPPCGLCREPKELQRSHYLAAGFYKRMRGDETQRDPILLGDARALPSSKQVRDHLLCADCESRFSTRGEAWVLANCSQPDGVFPLRDALRGLAPVGATASVKAFAGTAIGVEQLAYFAVSVFWRGAAHDWPPLVGKQRPPRLDLGPYEERFRQFLLDEGPFGEGAALLIFVSALRAGVQSNIGSFPQRYSRTPRYREYRFFVPGLTFQLFTGQGLPPGLRGCCSVRSGLVYVAPRVDRENAIGIAQAVAGAERLGRLRRGMAR